MDNRNLKKLVIIPAYNEESSIEAQYEEVRKQAPDYDVLVINDGSGDRTAELCYNHHIEYLDLAVNLGIGGAVQTGYRYAALNGYDIAVQVDGDGQHDPAYLPSLCEALLQQGADMVVGSRFIEKEGDQSGRIRRMGIRYFSRLIRLLCGQRITDPTSGLRMVGRKLIEEFASDYPQDYPEPESIVRVLKNGYTVTEIPVRMRKRAGGRSSIRPAGAIYYMVKVTIAVILERMR